MGRPLTGKVIENTHLDEPTFALRFTAYGKRRYITLGPRSAGWTLGRAEAELQNVLADVRREIWRPTEPEPVVLGPREIPTFHEFASEWFERQKAEGGRRGGGLTDVGVTDLQWRLTNHLLPWFKSVRLDAISVEDVDRYRLAKVRERDAIEKAKAAKKPLMESYTDPHTGRQRMRRKTALSATSINKTLATLSAILETAVEYGHLDRNPAHGRRRRLPSTTPARTSLERAEHITALLDAAGDLDAAARTRRGQRRALIATLVFAGLRISEALSLQWGDVDLARTTIKVRASKTDAGVRTVNIVPILRDEFLAYKARTAAAPGNLVFGSSEGNVQSRSNIAQRVLSAAVETANKKLRKASVEPMPTLTPHSLRRTFATVLFAIGEAPPYVMAQMGHTTAQLTLAVYAREIARRDGEPARLKILVEGAVLAEETAETPEVAEHKDQTPKAV